jgi:predicted nuclease with RNAse H fold
MDEKFRETLLPLLREGWPGLERIATRGGNVLEDLEDMECVIVDVDERVESCWNATVREEG